MIVEIGSDTGKNTENILNYCISNNAKLVSIDPAPNFDVKKFKSKYQDAFVMEEDISLNVLPNLKNYDCILIDGDHNWYTVYNELKIIEKLGKKNMPLIFLHDVCWPYGKRDLYYNPKLIPKNFLNPYRKKAISLENDKLVDEGINGHLNNSIRYGGKKNGVVTAVYDFIKESSLNFSFKIIPIFHGLGILYLENKSFDKYLENLIEESKIFEFAEKFYLKSYIKEHEINETINNERNSLKEKINQQEKVIKENNLRNEILTKEIREKEESFFKKELKLDILNLKFNQQAELLNSKNEDIVSLERNLFNSNQSINIKDNEINQLKNENKHLNSLIIDKESEIDNLNVKFKELKSKEQSQLLNNEVLVSQNELLKKENNNLLEKIIFYKKNIKKLESNEENLEFKNIVLKNKNKNIKETNDDLREINEKNNVLIDKLKERNNNLTLSKKQIFDENVSLNIKNEELNNSLSKIYEENEAYQKSFVFLEKEKLALGKEISELIKDNESLRGDYASLRGDYESLKNNNESLKNNNENLLMEIKKYKFSKSWKITKPLRKLLGMFKKN